MCVLKIVPTVEREAVVSGLREYCFRHQLLETGIEEAAELTLRHNPPSLGLAVATAIFFLRFSQWYRFAGGPMEMGACFIGPGAQEVALEERTNAIRRYQIHAVKYTLLTYYGKPLRRWLDRLKARTKGQKEFPPTAREWQVWINDLYTQINSLPDAADLDHAAAHFAGKAG